MKKISYIFTSLAILLLGFTSCSNESELISRGTNGDCKVSFRLNNKASSTRTESGESSAASTGDAPSTKKDFTTAALEREKKITSLYAVAFNNENDAFYRVFQIDLPAGTNSCEFDMRKSGTYKLILIANPDDALVNKLNAFTVSSTLAELSTIIAEKSSGEGADATDFLMVSEVLTDVSVVKNSTQNLGEVGLTRLAARFDFYNQVKGLKMTKITFKRRAINSLLIETTAQNGITFTDNKVYTSADGVNPLSAVGAIYGYEDATINDCEFILEGTFNGKAIVPESIKFKDLAVQRNHLYNIIITADESGVTPSPDDPTNLNGKLTFKIEPVDWTEAETFGITGDELINTDAPTFVATGEHVVITPATGSVPAVVNVPCEGTVVTIMATSASSADSKLVCTDGLPSGWKIMDRVDEDISSKGDQLTHQFTIEIPRNTILSSRTCHFSLANVFDSSAKVIFVINQEPKPYNPLSVVAEFNLAGDRMFATKHSVNKEDNKMFTLTEANSGTIAPDGYHVPSLIEVRVICPDGKRNGIDGPAGTMNVFSNSTNRSEEPVLINGQTLSNRKYDSKRISESLCYALRFKKSDGSIDSNSCAYRYQYFKSTTGGKAGMVVICRPFTDFYKTSSIATIASESYWASNKENDVIRFFPNCGINDKISDPNYINYIGTGSGFWLSNTKGVPEGLIIFEDNITNFMYLKTHHMPLRVFAN